MRNQRRTRRRHGFLLQEAITAMLIVSALIVGVHQIIQAVSKQRREANRMLAARLEASNAMEHIFAGSWDSLSDLPDAASQVSQNGRQHLPDARIQIAIITAQNNPSARRITVEVDWKNESGTRSTPVKLVAWRYPVPEDDS